MDKESWHGHLAQRLEVCIDAVGGAVLEGFVQHLGELVQFVRVVAETKLTGKKIK